MKRSWHKYHAQKVERDGFSFDSRLEGGLYGYMKLLELAGEISDIRVKPNVRLTDAKILMIPDFCAFDTALKEVVYFEAKGLETDVWRIKRRLWLAYGPGRLRVFKGSTKMLTMTEELIPRSYADASK